MRNSRTHRILRMLMMMSGSRRFTMKELQSRLEMSERNLYRDLSIIEEAGFLLDKENGTYRLHKDSPATKNLQKLFHFSEEEACILYQTLSLIEGDSPVKARLVRKLNTFYDLKVLEQLRQSDDLTKVKMISDSIAQKKQVSLLAYRSSNSNSIQDREVEAFDFLPDYDALWCYDIKSKSCKQFKVARMQSVELLSFSWRYEEKHRKPFTDVFRVSAVEPLGTVELLLSLKAYNLLIEEYPLAAEHIKLDKKKYRLSVPVASYQGIGRFVMGLLEEVEIVKGEGFKEFLRGRVKSFLDD